MNAYVAWVSARRLETNGMPAEKSSKKE